MYLKFRCSDTFNIGEVIIVFQDIEDIPQVLSFGRVVSVENNIVEVYVDSNNFVTGFPIYLTKVSNTIKVDLEF